MKSSSVFLAVAAAAAIGFNASAAEYPNQPVRVIVPYGAGGATDTAARIVSEAMSKVLGQPVVVENKPGANGVVAIQDLVASPADGYTLLVGNVTTNAINPILEGAAMPVDVKTALKPVARMVEVPAMMIATKKNFPPNTVAELVEYAKAKPGEILYNSSGVLAYSHLDWIQFEEKTGVSLTMVPVAAGGGAGQVDIVNGDVQLSLRNVASAAPFVKSGEIKALAVTTAKRLPDFPDTPTMTEQGFEGIGTNAWQAAFVRAEVPDDVVEKLNKTINDVLASDEVRGRFAALQIEVTPTASPAEAKTWLDGEFVKWAPVVEHAKTVVDSGR